MSAVGNVPQNTSNTGAAAAAAPAAAQKPALSPQVAPKPEMQKPKIDPVSLGAQLAVQPVVISAPQPKPQATPAREEYTEQVERLEQMIQVQQAVAQKVATQTEPGKKPNPKVLVVDLTTQAKLECDPCAKQSKSKKANVGVNLLGDASVIFQEQASREGGDHAIVAYDENGVYVVRDFGSNDSNDVANKRLLALLDARKNPGAKIDGLDDAKGTFTESPNKGKGPQDKAALDKAIAMAKDAGGGDVVMLKGSVAPESLAGYKDIAKDANVGLSGVAFGDRAATIQKGMFEGTRVAPDAMGARKAVGQAIGDASKR